MPGVGPQATVRLHGTQNQSERRIRVSTVYDYVVKDRLGQEISLSEKTKNFYNIMGDYPDTVAEFMVGEMLKNPANNAHINWLTGKKVMMRFITAPFKKRNFFN